MATNKKYPQALLWCDLEGTGVDIWNDYILEAAFIITDFNFQPYAGLHEVITPTKASIEQLRSNPVALEMHRKNGLIDDFRKETKTLAEVEEDVIQMLQEKTSFTEGEFQLAGSGVERYDMALITRHMPRLRKWLVYWSLDISNIRSGLKLYNGGRLPFNPPKASYVEGEKQHRAWDDVQAHIQEAQAGREWVRGVSGS